MEIVVLILAVLILVALGVVCDIHRNKKAGTIYVDQKDLDLYLELEVPVEDVISRKQVTFNIAIIPSDSHE